MPDSTREQVAAEIAQGQRWQEFGDCRKDPELFFGPDGERQRERLLREALAKSVCALCVVKSNCAEYALAADEKLGVWGGLGEDERKELRRRGQAA